MKNAIKLILIISSILTSQAKPLESYRISTLTCSTKNVSHGKGYAGYDIELIVERVGRGQKPYHPDMDMNYMIFDREHLERHYEDNSSALYVNLKFYSREWPPRLQEHMTLGLYMKQSKKKYHGVIFEDTPDDRAWYEKPIFDRKLVPLKPAETATLVPVDALTDEETGEVHFYGHHSDTYITFTPDSDDKEDWERLTYGSAVFHLGKLQVGNLPKSYTLTKCIR
jgi:hypothetical protein